MLLLLLVETLLLREKHRRGRGFVDTLQGVAWGSRARQRHSAPELCLPISVSSSSFFLLSLHRHHPPHLPGEAGVD